MQLTKQIAKHLRDVHFGGNWTFSNLKDNLEGITWQQATTQVYNFNTIATLVFHINYFIEAVTKVLEGGPLDAKDIYSFNHPPIQCQADWDAMVQKSLQDAERFASLIALVPDEKLNDVFQDEKYGNYFRNFLGIIEHTHYHLGQIAIIKKIVQTNEQAAS
ncbi:MAG: hypothetical protein RLY16_1640 [Bacteroidota bacterium]|jgi:uncharacterized damage-inducible protein DinB